VSTELKTSVVTHRSTLELTADWFEIATPTGSPPFRTAAPDATVEAIDLGYRENGVPVTVRVLAGGIIDEWGLAFTPVSIIGAIRGRNQAAKALDTYFNMLYVVNPSTGQALACGTAPPGGLVLQPENIGPALASTIAQAACTAAGLTLQWEIRDYALTQNFSAHGRVIDTIKALAAPWDLVGPFKVDIVLRGTVLVVKHRTPPPPPLNLPARVDYPQVPAVLFPLVPADYAFTMADARRTGLTLKRRRLQRIGQVTLHGSSGLAGGAGGQSEETTTDEFTTVDQYGLPQQTTVTTVRQLVPSHLVLHTSRQVYMYVARGASSGGGPRRRLLVTLEDTTYNYGADTVLAYKLIAPSLFAFLGAPGSGGTWGSPGLRGWQITAFNGLGETTGSVLVTVNVNDVTATVTLSWNTIVGALGYRLYRNDAPGNPFSAASLLTEVGNAKTSFIDVGGATSAGSPPGANGTGTISVPASDRLNDQHVVRTEIVYVGSTDPTALFDFVEIARQTLFEDTGYVRDACGFLSMQTTVESVAVAAATGGAPAEKPKNLILGSVVKQWRVVGPERVELRTTRYTSNGERFTPTGSDTLVAGGFPPDGPGRSGAGGIGSAETIVQTATISTEPTAQPLDFSTPLTLDDLNFILTLLAASDNLWEWEAQFSGVAMPWLQTGLVLQFSGLRGEDGLPIDLPPLVVTEVETVGDQSRQEASLTQPTVRAFGYTKVA
jgi:hypothetical protein